MEYRFIVEWCMMAMVYMCRKANTKCAYYFAVHSLSAASDGKFC